METSISRILLCLFVCASALISTQVHADNKRGWYLGLGGASIDSNVQSESGSDLRFNAVNAILGYKYKPYVGGELRVGAGLSDSETDTDLGRIENSLPLYSSLYYRLEAANKIAKVYVLAGVSYVSSEQLNLDSDELTELSDTGVSWGVGIGFATSKKVNLNFEFINLINNDSNDFDLLSVSLDYRF